MKKRNYFSHLKTIFRALQYRNYRLFFTGQSISLIGTWMQHVALSWLVYRMTNSPFLLGLVAFTAQIPTFILTPVAGVIADRFNRHRLLLITQVLAMIQAAVLATCVLTEFINIWIVLALSLIFGMINAFDIPVRQSFTIEMIEDKKDLSNAIALNSSMVNMAKLIGPSMAGLLIALWGESVCFVLNAVSYLAVIISLMKMNVVPRPIQPGNWNIHTQIKEGFSYAFNFAPIRLILLLLGLISLVGGGYQTLLPVFAKDIFHGGPTTLGVLMAGSGFGALCGAVYLASRKTVLGLGKVMVWMSLIFGGGIILFGVSRWLPASLALGFCVGFGMMVQMASSNTVLQLIVEDDKRGRVMSFYTMAFMGTAPLGSLLVGLLAGHLGAGGVLVIGGVCCVVGAIMFHGKLPVLREHIRPIYARKGIIPEVAQGIQSATVAQTIRRTET